MRHTLLRRGGCTSGLISNCSHPSDAVGGRRAVANFERCCFRPRLRQAVEKSCRNSLVDPANGKNSSRKDYVQRLSTMRRNSTRQLNRIQPFSTHFGICLVHASSTLPN